MADFFHGRRVFGDKGKAIAADDCAGLCNEALTNDNVMANRDMRVD